MFGYFGKILRINLTTHKTSQEELGAEIAATNLGGHGFVVDRLLREVPFDSDPLGEMNKLVFATGPLTGTNYPSSGRYHMGFKSPLTGVLCDASSGGFWGANLKASGFDCLIIEGKAVEPVYININDDVVDILPAKDLWGTTTYECENELKQRHQNSRVACIGPAGEKLVSLACILNDESRTAARGGGGAVMGSKKLKAIVVRGSKRVSLADREGFISAAKNTAKLLRELPHLEDLREKGTPNLMDGLSSTGDIPAKNWRLRFWEDGYARLGGKRMAETIMTKHVPCRACTIGCTPFVEINDGRFAMKGAAAEYETLASLGSLCLIDNLEAVSFANDLCNQYGIDTISTGNCIAFAMEAAEKGLLESDDGLDLSWGNADSMVALVKKIGTKEGIGEILGKGVRAAAKEIGGCSSDFAIEVKGMEAALHDPRFAFSMAGTYATSPRGACHLHGMSMIFEGNDAPLPEWGLNGFYPPNTSDEKGKLVKLGQDLAAIINSMVICYFVSFGQSVSDFATILTLATGIEFNPERLKQIGERVNETQRLYNTLCGLTGADDRLPKRLLNPAEDDQPGTKMPHIERILANYYEERGWSSKGIPTESSLKRHGLGHLTGSLKNLET